MAPYDPMRRPGGRLSKHYDDTVARDGAQEVCEAMDSPSVVAYAGRMDEYSVELDKPWLSVADICEYMDVSTFVVTSVLRSGELPAVKFGREWRVSKEDFETWINEQRRTTPTQVEEQDPSHR